MLIHHPSMTHNPSIIHPHTVIFSKPSIQSSIHPPGAPSSMWYLHVQWITEQLLKAQLYICLNSSSLKVSFLFGEYKFLTSRWWVTSHQLPSDFPVISHITFHLFTSSSSSSSTPALHHGLPLSAAPSLRAPPLISNTLKQRERKRQERTESTGPRCLAAWAEVSQTKPRGHFPGRQVLVSEAGERGVESQQVERNKQREADTNTGTVCFKCRLSFGCCYL